MSNSIHFEQLFERFSRFLDRQFSQPEKEGEGASVRIRFLEWVTTHGALLAFLFLIPSPVVSSSSENSVRVSSAKIERALGGGSYVTGMTQPSFGYVAQHAVHLQVSAYDANGKLLAERIDNINGNNLVRWHLRPSPRAPFTVFFPWNPFKSPKSLSLNTAATRMLLSDSLQSVVKSSGKNILSPAIMFIE
jgi:hypothetical protein